MRMELTPLDGIVIIEPRVFVDDRSFFSESYNKQALADVIGFGGELCRTITLGRFGA